MNLMILDPTNEAVPVERQISERPKTLTGKVAFLDISKPRGNVLLDRLQEAFEQRLPGVEINRYMKLLSRSLLPMHCGRRFSKTIILLSRVSRTEAPVPRAVCMTRYGSRFRVRLRFQLLRLNLLKQPKHRPRRWV